MKQFLFIGLTILAGLATARSANADRTNLVVIMTDDQGAWSLGCYGNPEARTPACDKLAADGVRFTNAFAATPVCSPSRATFFTGRISSQHGIHDWIKHENIGPRARYCLEDEVLLSQVLVGAGYTCGLVGKWHLGGNLTAQAGFSYWYVLPQGSSQYQNATVIFNGKTIKTTGYLTDRITDRAIEFLDGHRDKPFYLEVQYNAPHSPWSGHDPELVKLFDDCPFQSIPKVPRHLWASVLFNHLGDRQVLQQYFAACAGIDRGVKNIVAHLDKLGLSDNTLVVFTSDQGFCCGHRGLWGKGNASNPRNMFDPSIRVPMIFRHTGRLPAGQLVDAFVSSYDFVPTLLDYLGLPASPGRNLPGRSFAPALNKQELKDWPDAVFGEYSHARMIRTADYKYVRRANGGPHELYDLRNDPEETTNLADSPDHHDVRIKLRTRLITWFDQYAEAGADPVGNEYIHPDEK